MTRRIADLLGPLDPEVAWIRDLAPTMPDLTEALHDTGVDPAAFAEELRVPLEYFKSSAHTQRGRGQPTAVIEWLERSASDVEAAIAGERLQHLPYHAGPNVDCAAFKLYGRTWDDVLRSGNRDAIRDCLTAGANLLRGADIKVRRPRTFARDLFLLIVLDRLVKKGLLPRDAEYHTSLVLEAFKIPRPEESIARAARRAREALSKGACEGQFLSR